jgi:thiamine biosynthesis lipoprotein
MTAGTYRHFFEGQGQVYSHILNPHTGRPVIHSLLSVTILHEDPTLADVWDTALLCVGEAEAIRIAEAEHLRVLLISKDKDQLREYMSTGFFTPQIKLPSETEVESRSLLQGNTPNNLSTNTAHGERHE